MLGSWLPGEILARRAAKGGDDPSDSGQIVLHHKTAPRDAGVEDGLDVLERVVSQFENDDSVFAEHFFRLCNQSAVQLDAGRARK